MLNQAFMSQEEVLAHNFDFVQVTNHFNACRNIVSLSIPPPGEANEFRGAFSGKIDKTGNWGGSIYYYFERALCILY